MGGISNGPHLQIKMNADTPDKKSGQTPDSLQTALQSAHELRSQSLLQFYKPTKINPSKVKMASNQ
jgi:hypothetical protein